MPLFFPVLDVLKVHIFFRTYLFDFMHFLQHPLHIFICVIHIVYVSVTHFDVSSTNVVFYLSFDSSNVPLYSVYRHLDRFVNSELPFAVDKAKKSKIISCRPCLLIISQFVSFFLSV